MILLNYQPFPISVWLKQTLIEHAYLLIAIVLSLFDNVEHFLKHFWEAPHNAMNTLKLHHGYFSIKIATYTRRENNSAKSKLQMR